MLVEFLIGIPGSGKSTYAKAQVHPNPFHADVARINKDDIRETWKKLNEKAVLAKQEEMFCGYANQQYKKIIVDNTHLNPIHEARYRYLASQFGYDFEVKWFDDSLDPDLCHKRNIARDKTVPWTVIETMYSEYFKMWMKRESFEVVNSGKKAIIVDLDGTVADNDGHRGWFDWAKVRGDKVHQDIKDLVVLLHNAGHYVVFLSGRDSVCWKETSEWLTYYFDEELDGQWSLFMRPEGDSRKDSFVKVELFQEFVNGRYDVRYVLDDRHQVVRMWRAMGLRCLSVDNGYK